MVRLGHHQNHQNLTLGDRYTALGLFAPEYALADNGDDTRTTQGYLGHRDRKHTAIYTRTAAKQLARLWR